MPAYSTSTHQGNPVPNQDDRLLDGSAGPLPFFSQVIRVGAANPVFSPLPAFPQLLEGLADGLDAYLMGAQPLLEAHLSSPFQGPEAGRLVEVAGALMQHLSEGLPAGVVEDGPEGLGAGGLSVETSHSLAVKGMNDVTCHLWGAAHSFSDLLWGLALAAGQDDLAAAEGKGIGGGVKARLKLISFLAGQWANKD